MKSFRVALITQRLDFIITNNLSQDSAQAKKKESSRRWKIK